VALRTRIPLAVNRFENEGFEDPIAFLDVLFPVLAFPPPKTRPVELAVWLE
jgi:hypothetical protein